MLPNLIPFRRIFLKQMFLAFWVIIGGASCTYSAKKSQKLYGLAAQNQYDLVIVPGAPVTDSGWNKTLKGRIYWSKFLYDRGIAKNIMYSGAAVYSPIVEASAMAAYARGIGIAAEHVFEETRAEHSTENLYYSFKKARQLGFKKIALASDPFQTRMLKRYALKRLDPEFGLIPMVIDSMKIIEPTMTDPVLDLQKYRDPDFRPLKEREGFFKRLKGTMGLNMDRKAYE